MNPCIPGNTSHGKDWRFPVFQLTPAESQEGRMKERQMNDQSLQGIPFRINADEEHLHPVLFGFKAVLDTGPGTDSTD